MKNSLMINNWASSICKYLTQVLFNASISHLSEDMEFFKNDSNNNKNENKGKDFLMPHGLSTQRWLKTLFPTDRCA